MMLKINFKSLKTRLFFSFLAVSIVAVSILGAIAYLAGKNILQKTIVGDYTNINSVTSSSIGNYLSEAKVEWALTGGDYHTRELTEKILKKDPDSPRLLKELIAYNKEFQSANPDTIEYFIVDMSGKILASTDEKHIGVDRAKDSYFTEGQKGVYLKDVYRSDITGKIGFVISGPMYSVNSKDLLGVFCIRYDMSGLKEIVEDYTGMGKTGETYVVNKDGYFITDSRFSKDMALKQKVDTEPVKLWQSQKRDMAGIFPDYQGNMSLGVALGESLFKKEPGLGWLVISEIDAAEAFVPIRRLGFTILILGLIISIVTAVIAYMIAQGIANPIVLIAQIAQRVSEGDLTKSISIKSDDEIGVLANSFNAMIGNLSQIIAKTKDATNQITSAGSEILAASQEQASGAREQSSAVAETSSAAKELSITSEQVGESIKRVSQAATHAMAGMAKIKEAIGKTNTMITSLGEKSQQIGKITDLIDDVADQTNLLAVNASIEAARAGEQGRGFTVVADEIRKLADSTAKSTKDITALIEIIQHEMTNSIMSMETSVTSIDDEAKLAAETADSAKEIAMSTSQQISGSKQIADAMLNIDDAMKQIAAGAQQSQAAVKQLTDLAVGLKKLTQTLK